MHLKYRVELDSTTRVKRYSKRISTSGFIWTREWMNEWMYARPPSSFNQSSWGKRPHLLAHTQSHGPATLVEQSRWSHQPAKPALVSFTFLFCSRDAVLLLFLRFSFSSSIAFTSTSPRFFFNWEAAWAMIGNKKKTRRSTTHYTRVPHLKSQRSSGAIIWQNQDLRGKNRGRKGKGGKGKKNALLEKENGEE